VLGRTRICLFGLPVSIASSARGDSRDYWRICQRVLRAARFLWSKCNRTGCGYPYGRGYGQGLQLVSGCCRWAGLYEWTLQAVSRASLRLVQSATSGAAFHESATSQGSTVATRKLTPHIDSTTHRHSQGHSCERSRLSEVVQASQPGAAHRSTGATRPVSKAMSGWCTTRPAWAVIAGDLEAFGVPVFPATRRGK